MYTTRLYARLSSSMVCPTHLRVVCLSGHSVCLSSISNVVCLSRFSTSSVARKARVVTPTKRAISRRELSQDTTILDDDRGSRTAANSLTPLYSQIKTIIDLNPGCVCLVQVGGFYELYFEQATIYGPKLGIKVANRTSGPYLVPMSGFPLHQLKKFVKMLVQDLSETVAIVDQRPSIQNTFHRRVSRIISPGTLIDESFMNFDQNNYLLAISVLPFTTLAPDPDTPVGLSWIDMSVGEFYVQQTTLGDMMADVSRINPSEIIMTKAFQDEPLYDTVPYLLLLRRYFTRYHAVNYDGTKIRFKASTQLVRKCMERLSVREEAAMNMVLSYINVNFPEARADIELPVQYWNKSVLHMDASTRDALELTERTSGGRSLQVGSLLSTIRRTKTSSGNRLLTQWIKSPSLDVDELIRRQNFVALFLERNLLKMAVRTELASVGDISRHLQRLAFDTGDTVGALVGVTDGLTRLHSIECILRDEVASNPSSAPTLEHFLEEYTVPMELAHKIGGVLEQHASTVDEVPEQHDDESSSLETGSYSNSSIARYRRTAKADVVQEFQVKRDTTEPLLRLHEKLDVLKAKESAFIDKLANSLWKIDPKLVVTGKLTHGRFNNVLHISGRAKLLDAAQGLLSRGVVDKRKTALLYKPEEWTEMQYEIDGVFERILVLEQQIIRELREQVLDTSTDIRRIIKLTDYLDVTCSFAVLAEEANLVRPKFLRTPLLRVRSGRHLVVENGLRNSSSMFTCNDTAVGPTSNMWVITGPNMGGKSTFLRQNALIVILAQIGLYVPAEKASLGIVDKIFTRIGASDDLFNDMSTFMVEMVETSNILKNATPNSLAIVDEIGRGTSGKEGLAIAYATLVNLLKVNKCRTLFATHFGNEIHSLLARNGVDQKKIVYRRTRVLHDDGSGLTIDHTLEPGISERSYAFEVAQMAGFPKTVLENAKKALNILSD